MFSNKKIGGIRFIKIGRFQFSFCRCRTTAEKENAAYQKWLRQIAREDDKRNAAERRENYRRSIQLFPVEQPDGVTVYQYLPLSLCASQHKPCCGAQSFIAVANSELQVIRNRNALMRPTLCDNLSHPVWHRKNPCH